MHDEGAINSNVSRLYYCIIYSLGSIADIRCNNLVY